MNEFIEVTKANGGKMITINTNSIIYFRSSKHSKSNRTEILVNGIERPFILEECYEDVKSKIYHPKDSASEYDEYYGRDNNSEDYKKETEDNKEFNIIGGCKTTIGEYIDEYYGRYNSKDYKKETEDDKLNVIKSDYRTTVKEYLEDDNTVIVDYEDLNYDNYRIIYKDFFETHRVSVHDDNYNMISFIKISTFKDQSNIVMYMTDINGNIYNMIDYDYYIGRDILSVYLNDLITRSKDEIYQIDGHYELIVEFPEAIIKNETEDNKALKNETEDNKEFNIIINGRYKSTIREYLEYNDHFLDYRRLYNDREYRIAYKNLLKTHLFRISYSESSEESIGYLHLKTFRDNSVIVIYMTNVYDEIYNDIYYNESDYMGCDIIAKYLKDCVNRKNIIGNYGYEDYKLDVDLDKNLL